MGRAPEKEKPVNLDLVAELGDAKLLVVLVPSQSWRTECVRERGYEVSSMTEQSRSGVSGFDF